MSIEKDSILFLEMQMESNFKEIFNEYLINNMEWIEVEDGMRPYTTLINLTTGKISNMLVLFPTYKLGINK